MKPGLAFGHRGRCAAFLLGAWWALSTLAGPASAAAKPRAPTENQVVAQYSALVFASYDDALIGAQRMQTAIEQFVARPTARGLEAARSEWRAAREFYSRTEAFRFYGGPIDGDDGPEPRINSWPVDESYVDSVKGRMDSGIINDPSVPITEERLIALNQRDGEENVATGWHAIEFLLWGQDFSDTGPGDRSFEDYVDGKALHADRRRAYLKLVTKLLIEDLTHVRDAWKPGENNYRQSFDREARDSLRRILLGLGSLARGELAGERLEVALATQEQEDEQSCFSDNTHRDVVNNAIGLRNVWSGRLQRTSGESLSGASLSALVAARDPALAGRIDTTLDELVAAAEAIHPPFDQEIRGSDEAPGRQRIYRTIDLLKRFSSDVVASARTLGIKRLLLGGGKKR